MINGLKYDWESVTALAPNGILFGINSINYSDEQDIKERYGKGSRPQGYGRGNYKAGGSLEMDLEEWERFKFTLGISIYDHFPFPITVSYGGLRLPPITDVMPAVKIVKVDTSNSQGSETAGTKKIDFICIVPIIYNGKPAKI